MSLIVRSKINERGIQAMKMILMFFVFLGMGVFMDWMLTAWMAAVANKKRKAAVSLSVVFTLINFFLIAALIKDIDSNAVNVVAYAIGNGGGTWLAMRKG
jgi:multidrug transporter EmrE-like cation transporter